MPLSTLFDLIDNAGPGLLALGVILLVGCVVAYAVGKLSKEQARAPIKQAAAAKGDLTLVEKFDEVLEAVDELAA